MAVQLYRHSLELDESDIRTVRALACHYLHSSGGGDEAVEASHHAEAFRLYQLGVRLGHEDECLIGLAYCYQHGRSAGREGRGKRLVGWRRRCADAS